VPPQGRPVASIDDRGLATGENAGVTNIRGSIGSTSSNPTILTVKPLPPTIASPLNAGATSVTGAEPGAPVQAFVNGVVRGAATTADAGGNWTVAGVAPRLVAGDSVTALQTVNSVSSDFSEPVTVSPPVLTSIRISPAPSATITKGQTIQFSAIGAFSDGSVQDPLPNVTWSSDPPTLASISPVGLATGVGPGIASIQATLGVAHSSVTALTIKPLPPVVTAPIIAGATTVTGSGAEPSGTVQPYVNNTARGATAIAASAPRRSIFGCRRASKVER
jgi:hypothetical protein